MSYSRTTLCAWDWMVHCQMSEPEQSVIVLPRFPPPHRVKLLSSNLMSRDYNSIKAISLNYNSKHGSPTFTLYYLLLFLLRIWAVPSRQCWRPIAPSDRVRWGGLCREPAPWSRRREAARTHCWPSRGHGIPSPRSLPPKTVSCRFLISATHQMLLIYCSESSL